VAYDGVARLCQGGVYGVELEDGGGTLNIVRESILLSMCSRTLISCLPPGRYMTYKTANDDRSMTVLK
jgi:hypothetical protein